MLLYRTLNQLIHCKSGPVDKQPFMYYNNIMFGKLVAI